MAIAHVQHDLYDVAGDGTLSFNVTHPGGSDVFLVVTVGWNKSWSTTVDSELYNAGAGTLLGEHNQGTRTIRQTYWVAPAAGTNAIAFSATGGTLANTAIVVVADWFTGVHQTTPVTGSQDNLTGAWTTTTHTALTAGAGDRLFLSTISDNPTLAWPSGDTNVTTLTSRGHDTTQSACSVVSGYTTLDGYDTIGYATATLANWGSSAFVLADTGVAPTYVPGPYNLRRRGRMAA